MVGRRHRMVPNRAFHEGTMRQQRVQIPDEDDVRPTGRDRY